MQKYKHEQIGTVIIFAFVLIFILTAFLLALVPSKEESSPFFVIPLVGAILSVSLLLFYRLSVQITDNKLQIRFGIGLIRRTWKIEDITSTEIVTYPWWYGWGIHFTPHGTIFNVSGFKAVALRLASGRTALIGTDEPEKLKQAIDEARRTV